MKRTVLIMLLAVAVCLPAAAQRFDAAIRGTVTDPTGAPVAGATVIAINSETGLTRTTTTNAAGTLGTRRFSAKSVTSATMS